MTKTKNTTETRNYIATIDNDPRIEFNVTAENNAEARKAARREIETNRWGCGSYKLSVKETKEDANCLSDEEFGIDPWGE